MDVANSFIHLANAYYALISVLWDSAMNEAHDLTLVEHALLYVWER